MLHYFLQSDHQNHRNHKIMDRIRNEAKSTRRNFSAMPWFLFTACLFNTFLGEGREIPKGRGEGICFPCRAIRTLHEGQADRLTGRRNPLEQIRRCRDVEDIKDILYINQVKHYFSPEKNCFINPYPSKSGQDNNWHWLSLNAGMIG